MRTIGSGNGCNDYDINQHESPITRMVIEDIHDGWLMDKWTARSAMRSKWVRYM